MSSPLRLLLYAPRFYPAIGGLEKVTEAWAGWLHGQGLAIEVVTNTPDPTGKTFPYPVWRRVGAWQQYRAMRRAQVVVQLDVSLKGLPLWWLSRRPLVISHHTALRSTSGLLPWRQQLKLWCSQQLPILNIACSHFIARGIDGRAVVVPSPYDASMFRPSTLPRRPLSLLFAGRLVSVKGLQVLLQSLALLFPKWPGLQLTLLGDGPERHALQQQIEAKGWQRAVTVAGAATGEAVAAAMASHRVLVVPSLQEPFGTVVLEGLASGCVVVTSTVGGLPEAGGNFTLQVPPADAVALASAIQQALEQAPAAAPGLASFLQQHTVEATASLFLSHIQQALAARYRK